MEVLKFLEQIPLPILVVALVILVAITVVIKKVKERASYPLFCCERRTSWQFHEI